MAKKVTGYIKLQIKAGKATPAPPVGPALGQHGVNIMEFTKQFNAKTADMGDLIIPVVITVYSVSLSLSTLTDLSVSSPRLRRHLFFLRRQQACRRRPVFRTSRKSVLSPRIRSKRSPR